MNQEAREPLAPPTEIIGEAGPERIEKLATDDDLTVMALRVSGPIGGPVRIQVEVHVEDKDGNPIGAKNVDMDVTNPGNFVEGMTRVSVYLDRVAQKLLYSIVDRAQKDPAFAKSMGMEDV